MISLLLTMTRRGGGCADAVPPLALVEPGAGGRIRNVCSRPTAKNGDIDDDSFQQPHPLAFYRASSKAAETRTRGNTEAPNDPTQFGPTSLVHSDVIFPDEATNVGEIGPSQDLATTKTIGCVSRWKKKYLDAGGRSDTRRRRRRRRRRHRPADQSDRTGRQPRPHAARRRHYRRRRCRRARRHCRA